MGLMGNVVSADRWRITVARISSMIIKGATTMRTPGFPIKSLQELFP